MRTSTANADCALAVLAVLAVGRVASRRLPVLATRPRLHGRPKHGCLCGVAELPPYRAFMGRLHCHQHALALPKLFVQRHVQLLTLL